MTRHLVAALVAFAPALSAQQGAPCLERAPHHEHLERAIRRGDVETVRRHLDEGGGVNETWRETPAQVCRSLVLRSAWHGQDGIFRLLLERGADLTSAQGYLMVPVRAGRVEIVRALLAGGVTPEPAAQVLEAALRSPNVAMLDLLLSAGLPIAGADLPAHYLTDDLIRALVPRYVDPDLAVFLGMEPCDVERAFGLTGPDPQYCEGHRGALWLHFVLTGDHETVEYLIAHGADLDARAAGARPFTALELAVARNDTVMVRLLERAAGARRR